MFNQRPYIYRTHVKLHEFKVGVQLITAGVTLCDCALEVVQPQTECCVTAAASLCLFCVTHQLSAVVVSL
jgi:hypothetical protein